MDEDTKVIRSVKKNLYKAEKALKKGSYSQAERACHAAMGILGSSKNAEKQVYLEAAAIVMDKVNLTCTMNAWPCTQMMHNYSMHYVWNNNYVSDFPIIASYNILYSYHFQLANIYLEQKKWKEVSDGCSYSYNYLHIAN